MHFRLPAAALAALTCLPAAALAATPILTPHLVLNELMPNPPGTDAGAEWVELYNPTSATVRLDGWGLSDHDGAWDALAGREVRAFGTLVVTLAHVRLANDGDDLVLVNATGARVDRVVYGYGAPAGGLARHPVPGEGATLARHYLLADGAPAAGGDSEWYVDGTPTPWRPNDVDAP